MTELAAVDGEMAKIRCTHSGQHPIAVSSPVRVNATIQSELPPAVAEQAEIYPWGQCNPGE